MRLVLEKGVVSLRSDGISDYLNRSLREFERSLSILVYLFFSRLLERDDGSKYKMAR